MSKEFIIGKTKVGAKNPCFIIAEIGINFNCNFENALKLIDAAANAKCNAVKFQLFSAEKMYIPGAGEDKSGNGRKKDIYKIVKEGELPVAWIPKLKEYANKKGLEFICTACDEDGADTLEKYGTDAFKIASYEITHIPLLRHIAKKNKPVIFSCGGSVIKEVCEATEIFEKENNNQAALLHCVSNYGAEPSLLNLNVISMFKSAFPNFVIGYSDHSADPVKAPVAAIGLGAKIIEKHITLNKKMPGPDHFFALEPKELELMVKAVRKAEARIKKGAKVEISSELLGTTERKTYEQEAIPRSFAFRCIFAIKNIKKGEIFNKNNIAVLRPGNEKRGLDPKYFEILTDGHRATRDIFQHKSIAWDDVLLK